MLRQSLAFVAAASMAASPVLASPSAAPLSLSARAGADAENGNDLMGGTWFPPLLFATIVILGALTATGVIFDDDNDLPDSP
jgi:hypothetical protein